MKVFDSARSIIEGEHGPGGSCTASASRRQHECRCAPAGGCGGGAARLAASAGAVEEAVRVLVVDDSELIRRSLREILSSEKGLQVVAEAANGSDALLQLERTQPDVITLDVHMPVLDGVSTLKRIMIHRPRPTVMLSSLTLEGAKLTFDTLRYGAVDFLPKPSNLTEADFIRQRQEIVRRVRLAAEVEIEAVRYFRKPAASTAKGAREEIPCRRLVVTGAAEGGYAALLKVVPGLPPDFPAAFVAVLYAEPQYLEAFCEYLDQFSSVRVCRAVDGMPLQHGVCYLAAGSEYVTVQVGDPGPVLAVNPSPFQSRRGSVNMLMFSAAEAGLQSLVGVLLSGAGEDGLEGTGVILRCGGQVLVQEPGTCLYKQMPAAAIAAHGTGITAAVSDAALADELRQRVRRA